ncbi:MAG TPA: hypothetical protein VN880_09860 [Solirubrobacteraceae bacterium]|nr:hypothetical protein [Solirubrobacteraceae bacterium]
MSTGHTEGDPGGAAGPASEEELRAAYEAEIKKIGVEQVLLENVVTLINLGMRRTGLSPGTEDERDLEQVRVAIESIRALMPIVEQSAPAQAGPIREALSQLQLAFVRLGGAPAGDAGSGSQGGDDPSSGGSSQGGPPEGGSSEGGPPGGRSGPPEPEPTSPAQPGEPGPAQRSGRLWVPGQ